jgi:hypothetical protein
MGHKNNPPKQLGVSRTPGHRGVFLAAPLTGAMSGHDPAIHEPNRRQPPAATPGILKAVETLEMAPKEGPTPLLQNQA